MGSALAFRVARTWQGGAGAFLILLGALVALAAPALFTGDPLDVVARPLTRPFTNPLVPLGTDRLGRDILAGLVHGARGTLLIAGSVAAIALIAGAAVGTAAGYLGGIADEVLMRIADATQTVPGFVLALALVSVAGPSQPVIVLAIAAGAWTGPARVVRAEVLSLKERPFVEASRLVGRRPLAIAFQVVLPNALTPLIALAAVIVAAAILSESALAFLGLGDPNAASWGAMIAEGRQVMRTAPHVIIAPGLAVMATVLAASLTGDGLARALETGSSD
ncbi:MAG TPA: ABC transporter permease [Microvirga sp.]|nr:ABC transporter permease [Microvirga sp.]